MARGLYFLVLGTSQQVVYIYLNLCKNYIWMGSCKQILILKENQNVGCVRARGLRLLLVKGWPNGTHPNAGLDTQEIKL